MKIAVLPNGKTLQFSDNMHDSEIDKAVKAAIGVRSEEEVENEETDMEIRRETLNLINSVAKALNAIVGEMRQNTVVVRQLSNTIKDMTDQNTQTFERTSNILQRTMQEASKLSGSVRDLQTTISESSRIIASAYTAPKVLTKSDDNKTATIQVRDAQ